MTFDLHIQIDSDTAEWQIVETIASRDHVSPEDAVKRILRDIVASQKSPAKQMLGAFSDPADSHLLDEIVKDAYEQRRAEQPRDFGD